MKTPTMRVRFKLKRLETVRLPAVFGVGFQYDREAPAGMPKGQVILDSDPNNCGFRVVRSRPALVAPVCWNPTSKNRHLVRIKVASSVKRITFSQS